MNSSPYKFMNGWRILISLEFVTYWNVHILQWIGPFHVQERFMNCSWTMSIETFLNSSWTLCLEMFMNLSWIGPFHVQEPFMNYSCVVHEFCAWTVHARFLNSSWSFHQGIPHIDILISYSPVRFIIILHSVHNTLILY